MMTCGPNVQRTAANICNGLLAVILAFVAVPAVAGDESADESRAEGQESRAGTNRQLLSGSGSRLSTLDSRLPPRPIRRITVSADNREAWPAGQWVPIEAGELEKLLQRSRPKLRKPRKTWIERATYWATFDENHQNLRGGTLTADIRHHGDTAELLTLEPLNLAVSELAWADKEAIWGTTRDGHTALLVDGENRTLHGLWNLSGRKLPRSVEFDMRIPKAAVSQFRLRLPEGFLLKTSVGVITRLETNGKTGWQEWQLDLGSQTRCRITIREKEQVQVQARPFVLVESNCTYVIREDGLGLQAEFHVEAINTPANLLIFTLPAEVEVFSVTVGSVNSLSWMIIPNGKNQLIPVRLPDSLRGRNRPIRMTGFAPSKLGKTWELPQPKLQAALDTNREFEDLKDEYFTGGRLRDLNNVSFLRGQVHLTVDAPVKLQSIETRNFRQTGTVSTPDVSETFSYQQFRPNAILRVDVDYPKLQRAASVLTHVEMTGDNWSMTAHVDWRTRAGETFEVRCQLPPAWEVTEVRPRDDSSALTNWKPRRQKGGSLLLTMEFRESISPGRPKFVEVMARRLPFSRRQPMRLPLLQPVDHDSVAQMVAVSHPTTSVPVLDEKSTFRTVTDGEIPDFAAESELWKTIISSTNGSTLLLFSDELSATGLLRMDQRGGASVAAQIWITLELDSSRLTETFLAHIRPTRFEVDRVYVYLTHPGNEIEWHLQEGAAPLLKSVRVPPTRHKEWELPAEGELWEIHLPQPKRRKFDILGSRSQPLAASMLPALAIVPAASSFSGGIELRTAAGPKVDVDVNNLAVASVERLRQQGVLTPGERRPSGRLWQYDSIGGTLSLRVQGKKGDARYRQLATLSLKSVLPKEHSGFSRHLATFRFDQDADSHEFQFSLPQPAVLFSAALNGKSVAPRRLGQKWIIAPLNLNDAGQNTVEIEYRTPAVVTDIRGTQSIVVPQCTYTILDFSWEFATPPDTWLAGVPDFIVLHDRLPQLSWTERFFGPLGRPIDSLIFNPFSVRTWRKLQQPVARTNAGQQQSREEQFSPAGWTLYRATAPRPPQSLTINTWQHSQVRLLGWLGIIGCLLAGLLIRIRQLALRQRAFAYWLSGCLLAAWLSPPFYAIIGGGCLLGTVVSLLFPRRLLEKLRFQEPEAKDIVPLGSTASYRHSPATALLIAVFLSAAASAAQDTSTANRGSENPASTADSPGVDEIRILVPESSNGLVDKNRSIVYIERRELTRLRESALRGNAPQYLVASAEYLSRVDEQNTVTVDARILVHLLPAAKTAHVIFPDARSNPGRCRVNNKPHPVRLAPDGKHFYLDLARANESQPFGQVESFDVKLTLRPATKKISGGNGYRLAVIPVNAANLRQEFAQSLPTVELVGARGLQAAADDGRWLNALLGKTGQFQVLWSKNTEPVVRPGRLEAKVTTHVEARPTWLEFRYHVDYRVLSGLVDFLVWQIPHVSDKIAIREVTVDGESVDFSAASAKNGKTRLLIELGTSQQSGFAVDVFVVVPIVSDEDGGIRISTTSIVDDQTQPYSVSVTQDLLGISAPSEFDFTPTATEAAADGNGIRNLTVESFLARAGKVPSSRQPQFAYEIREPGELSFNLSPAVPQRKVRMIQTGIVRRNSIGWTLTAELETSRAPAFIHSLLVDPQLTITKISVREDDAERLIHWSRRGRLLQLFLSDKTTGIQSITLEGTRPLPLSQPARLPLIQIDDAEILNSRVRLYHERQLTVELIDAASLSPIKAAPPAAADDQSLELLGQYRLSLEPGDPRVRVLKQGDHLRSETVTRLVKREDRDWSVTYLFQFNSNTQPIHVIRLMLPAEIADNFHIEGKAIDSDNQLQPDGSVELTVRPQSEKTQSLRLQITATIADSPVGEWRLPAVVAGDVFDAGHYLLIADAPELQPAGHSADEVSYDGLPQWVEDAAVESQIGPDHWHAYFSDTPPWTLTVGSATRGVRSGRIPLVHTRIWFDGNANTYGRTTVMMMSSTEPYLELSWPDGMRVRALYVDGKAVIRKQTVPQAPGTLRVPLTPASSAHVVLLHWSRPSSSNSPLWWAAQSQTLPEPRTVSVDRSLVSFLPHRGAYLATRNGVEQIEPLDYELDVLESLTEMNRAYLKSGQQSSPLTTMLFKLYEKINVELGAIDREASGTDKIHQARRNRLETTSSDILRLRSLAVADTGDAKRNRTAYPMIIEDDFDLAGFAPNRSMIVGRVTPRDKESTPVVSFWTVNHLVLTGILLLIGLLVVPLIRRLVKLDIGRWLSNHQPVAWALLGLLWWTCLNPSAVGLVLLLVAVLVAIKDRQRQDPEPATVINETLDPLSPSALALQSQ